MSRGFLPLLDSRLFNSLTYCCICCLLGCWFSVNHLCNFGSSSSGSKLVLILVFWVGNWLWTVCMAGCESVIVRSNGAGGWEGTEYWLGYDGTNCDLPTGDWGLNCVVHHWSNLRRLSSDISGKGPDEELLRHNCERRIWKKNFSLKILWKEKLRFIEDF